MRTSKPLKLMLVVSGLIAAAIGGAILLMPDVFYATYGIELSDNVSHINEIKAPGGALLAMGVLIMAGAFVAELTFTSTVIATVLYLAYGISRLLSMAADGLPDGGLVWAAGLELVIGFVSLWALLRVSTGLTRPAQ